MFCWQKVFPLHRMIVRLEKTYFQDINCRCFREFRNVWGKNAKNCEKSKISNVIRFRWIFEHRITEKMNRKISVIKMVPTGPKTIFLHFGQLFRTSSNAKILLSILSVILFSNFYRNQIKFKIFEFPRVLLHYFLNFQRHPQFFFL